MLRYELKKVFSRTSNKVAMLLLAALVFITCYFALGVSWVDENGDSHSGPAAVARLRATEGVGRISGRGGYTAGDPGKSEDTEHAGGAQ